MCAMAKMKSTTTDNQGRPQPTQHACAEDSSGTDDGNAITYEKKGKRRSASRPVQSDLDKGGLGGASAVGEGGSNNNKKGGRTGPSPKKKHKRVASPSPSLGSSDDALDSEALEQQQKRKPAKRKKLAPIDREYMEDECRHQLNLLSHPSKCPPTAMSEDVFHTSCKLPRDGKNLHRLRMDKDVPLVDV